MRGVVVQDEPGVEPRYSVTQDVEERAAVEEKPELVGGVVIVLVGEFEHSEDEQFVGAAGLGAPLQVNDATDSNAGLLTTTLVPTNDPSSSLIHCLVSPDASHDVVLGFDWASLLRDSFISLGFRIDSSFDAWRYSLTRVIPCLLSPPLPGQTPVYMVHPHLTLNI
ncbi:hypothetical protein DFH09DRAFT_1362239 [Mycena vulgaris]|nr:hypothetical protein DFH09DRAFT_1362239 [Mycena vulgaris]